MYFMGMRLILFCLALFLYTETCQAESEIFKINNRLAVEVLPVVEAMLSPQGKAVADKYGNTIVVNDTVEILEEVRTLLLSSDQRIPQVRVQVAFDSADDGRVAGFTNRPWKGTGRHLSTEDTRYRYANSGRRTSGTSFIMVSSGSSGYVRMAREVPVTKEWIFLFRRHGVPFLLKETRTIETGMEVSPVVAGDQVIVTVTPRVSWMENGRADSFRFMDASTTVTIPRSQWFELGGMRNSLESDKEIFGRILSTGSSNEINTFLMKIKADIN